MTALLESGLTPISIEHLLAAMEGWAQVPARPIVLSFDDGWLIQRQEALPVLLELRLPAVFFVMPGFDRFGQGHFSLEDIRAVRAAGFTVASHTLNHAQLPELMESNLGAAQAEVVESRAVLEREIDGVDFFAYPGGRFDTAAQALVRDAGYRLALSTVPGIVHTGARRFELRRVAVQAWWPIARVRAAIRAAALVDGVDSPV
jgi:peptidoglycan/xylan/chitin deacetylase (PgdA/CDA1 family)